jgi:type I restriction enzyme S subunit
MSEWNLKPVLLGPLCNKIGSGITPRGGDTVYLSSGISLIRSQNIYNGEFQLDGLVYIDDRQATKMNGVEVKSGDVLLNITGDSVARACIVPDNVLPARVNQHVTIIRPQENVLDPQFLAYFFTNPRMQASMLSLAGSGGTRKALTKGMIEKFEIPCPDINIQHRIANILANYDELIGINRRRIRLFEDAARLLFREWFVYFRYPGHEHVKIVDGIPGGWDKINVSTFCTVGRGGSPRPIQDFLEGEVPWFKIGDATASESPFVFTTAEAIIDAGVKKSVFLPAKELILSNSATCGIPYFTGIPGCIHDGWLYFKNLRRVSKWFLYCCLCEKKRAILAGIGEGATQKNLNTNYISDQIVLLPRSPVLINHFNSLAEPLFDQIFALAQVNMQLRKARDLLLPRLMSGELEV